MNIRKPIFILGTGRCGSSIFNRMMCKHPSVAWLATPRIAKGHAGNLGRNRALLKAIDIPLIGRLFEARFAPAENYAVFDHYYPGFSVPFRDLTAADVTVKVKRDFHKAFEQVLTPKRDRLLVKFTGWPRMGFLREIFNDVKFIHIVRDGRAFANSLMNVAWWWGWRGPHNWRWGLLSSEWQAKWEENDKSFVSLAAIEWGILVDALRAAKKTIPDDALLDIKYEDLCEDPQGVMRKIVEWCELDWSEEFAAALARFRLRSTNYKWSESYTESQQRHVTAVIRQQLDYYQYD